MEETRTGIDMICLAEGVHPYEALSRKAKHAVCRKMIAEAQQASYRLFPALQSEDDKYLSFILTLIKEVAKSEQFIEDNREILIQILPTILAHSDIFKETILTKPPEQYRFSSDPIELQSKLVKRLIQSWEYLHCLRAYLARVNRILPRSDSVPDVNIPAGVDTDQVTKDIADKIELLCGNYQNYLRISGIYCRKYPDCRPPMKGLFYKSHWLYPVLPALFTLDAFHIMLNGEKIRKDRILLGQESNQKFNMPYQHTVLIQSGKALAAEISSVLSDGLCDCYAPMSYPIGKKWSSETGAYWRYDFFAFEGNEIDEEKPDNSDQAKTKYVTKAIPFALPICKIRRLAMTIIACCDLPARLLLPLIKELPDYLYRAQLRETAIKDKYGEQASQIVMVFRKLAAPEIYNSLTHSKAFWKDCIDITKPLRKTGFLKTSLEQEEDVKQFLFRYFTYEDITEAAFLVGAPIGLGYHQDIRLPSIFLKLYKQLRNTLEDYHAQAMNSSEKGSNTQGGNVLPHLLKLKILQMITLEQAIYMVEQALQKKIPSGQMVYHVLQASSEFDSIKVSLKKGNEEIPEAILNLLYRPMLKQSFQLIENTCIAVLFRASLMECEITPQRPKLSPPE